MNFSLKNTFDQVHRNRCRPTRILRRPKGLVWLKLLRQNRKSKLSICVMGVWESSISSLP